MDVAKKVAEMKRKAEALADEAAALQGYKPREVSADAEGLDGSGSSDGGASADSAR